VYDHAQLIITVTKQQITSIALLIQIECFSRIIKTQSAQYSEYVVAVVGEHHLDSQAVGRTTSTKRTCTSSLNTIAKPFVRVQHQKRLLQARET
jgi:ABC-type Fe2+-enterobactin transport system substrate-binding protein